MARASTAAGGRATGAATAASVIRSEAFVGEAGMGPRNTGDAETCFTMAVSRTTFRTIGAEETNVSWFTTVT